MPPKKTKSGKTDKRSTTSINNANNARAALLSYISKGKQIRDEEEYEPLETDVEESPLDEVKEPDVEHEQESEPVPEPEPEPKVVVKKVIKKRQPTQLEKDMAEIKSQLASLKQPVLKRQDAQIKPNTPVSASVSVPIKQTPTYEPIVFVPSYSQRQHDQINAMNKSMFDAFNNQWNK